MPLVLAAETPPIETPVWFWEAFVGGVIALLVLDLVLFNRRPHEPGVRESAIATAFWVAVAAGFGAWVWSYFGADHGKLFFSAYFVEESLSIDNLFVFLVIFQHFKVPPELRHRVLFLGILGAIVTRFAFISAGIALVTRFFWMKYLLGGFLVLTAAKLAMSRDEETDPSRRVIVRTVERFLPFAPEYRSTKLTTVKDGRRVATMLLLVILVIEATDVAFAVDSIPAVIGLTQEKFIVFTSNICAVLGLRSIFFLLARFMQSFRYLQPGLAIVLAFVGVKMFELFHVSSDMSLLLIASILAAATIASIVNPEKQEKSDAP